MDRMIPQRDFLLCKPTSASNLSDQTSGSGDVHVTESSQKCDVLPLGPSLDRFAWFCQAAKCHRSQTLKLLKYASTRQPMPSGHDGPLRATGLTHAGFVHLGEVIFIF